MPGLKNGGQHLHSRRGHRDGNRFVRCVRSVLGVFRFARKIGGADQAFRRCRCEQDCGDSWSTTGTCARSSCAPKIAMVDEMTGPQNPYLFIVGCPRSGTTLLRRMLDAHPQIAMTRETHWIPKVYERGVGLTPDGRVTSELLVHLLQDAHFQRMHVDLDRVRRAIASDAGLSYPRFVTLLFNLYGEQCDKPLVGDKTPGYTGKIAMLHALWPATRFVHLIRDGRDVCLSLLEWRPERFARRLPAWSRDPVSAAAMFWAGRVRAAREAGRALGPSLYREVRYESLVADPEGECRALCRFLGVPEDDAMVRFAEGRTKSTPGLESKKAWLPATKGLRNWRSEMPPNDVERFETAAGDLLEELGYPTSRERVGAERARESRGDPQVRR